MVKKTTTTKKKRVFRKVSEDKAFQLQSGEQLLHYVELADALADMQDDVLKHHVTEDRHDFAAWIEHVFKDKQLAQEIEPLTSKRDIRTAIYRHLVHKHLN